MTRTEPPRISVSDHHLVGNHAQISEAWKLCRGRGVTIAVIDDGVDVDHPEFAVPGKVVWPFDAVTELPDARHKRRYERHGTRCAGLAASSGHHGLTGVSPDSLLMPIRLGRPGLPAEARALSWAADHGADVILCAWGMPEGSWLDKSDRLRRRRVELPVATRRALRRAATEGRDGRGCVVVWAAGNSARDVGLDEYAASPYTCAVGASDLRGTPTRYSNFGRELFCVFPSSARPGPQPVTPGRAGLDGLWTTDRSEGRVRRFRNDDGDGRRPGYRLFGGTSAAASAVAGLFGLVLAANPSLPATEARLIVVRAATTVDSRRPHSGRRWGCGCPSALKAVRLAISCGRDDVEG